MDATEQDRLLRTILEVVQAASRDARKGEPHYTGSASGFTVRATGGLVRTAKIVVRCDESLRTPLATHLRQNGFGDARVTWWGNVKMSVF